MVVIPLLEHALKTNGQHVKNNQHNNSSSSSMVHSISHENQSVGVKKSVRLPYQIPLEAYYNAPRNRPSIPTDVLNVTPTGTQNVQHQPQLNNPSLQPFYNLQNGHKPADQQHHQHLPTTNHFNRNNHIQNYPNNYNVQYDSQNSFGSQNVQSCPKNTYPGQHKPTTQYQLSGHQSGPRFHPPQNPTTHYQHRPSTGPQNTANVEKVKPYFKSFMDLGPVRASPSNIRPNPPSGLNWSQPLSNTNDQLQQGNWSQPPSSTNDQQGNSHNFQNQASYNHHNHWQQPHVCQCQHQLPTVNQPQQNIRPTVNPPQQIIRPTVNPPQQNMPLPMNVPPQNMRPSVNLPQQNIRPPMNPPLRHMPPQPRQNMLLPMNPPQQNIRLQSNPPQQNINVRPYNFAPRDLPSNQSSPFAYQQRFPNTAPPSNATGSNWSNQPHDNRSNQPHANWSNQHSSMVDSHVGKPFYNQTQYGQMPPPPPNAIRNSVPVRNHPPPPSSSSSCYPRYQWS